MRATGSRRNQHAMCALLPKYYFWEKYFYVIPFFRIPKYQEHMHGVIISRRLTELIVRRRLWDPISDRRV